MDEAHPGIELWVPCEAFLDAGHANEDHPNTAVVKDIPHLFQTRGFQAIRLIDNDQVGRIRGLHTFLGIGRRDLGRRRRGGHIDLDDVVNDLRSEQI